MNNIVLPPWSVAYNPDKNLFPGVQLATRDGRVMGNAHIIAKGNFAGYNIFRVLTDAGNKVSLFEAELHEIFYVTDWVSDVEEVKKRFLRSGEYED